jgi:hypothetical protein
VRTPKTWSFMFGRQRNSHGDEDVRIRFVEMQRPAPLPANAKLLGQVGDVRASRLFDRAGA